MRKIWPICLAIAGVAMMCFDRLVDVGATAFILGLVLAILRLTNLTGTSNQRFKQTVRLIGFILVAAVILLLIALLLFGISNSGHVM